MVASTPDTIVLIHGLWITPRSWVPWVERFSSRGYRVLAPAWPGLDREVGDIRRDPSSLAGLGVTEIVDHYDRIIRELEQPPIIMGHSFGGLVTQLLVDRGLGAAAVPIAPAPPKGIVLLPWSSIRTAWPALKNPANRERSFTLSAKQFRYRFGNTLSEHDSNTANNSATTETTVDPAADLSLTKSDSPDPVLAGEIVTLYHDAASAASAEAGFDRVFKQHAMPDEIPEVTVSFEDEVYLPGMMHELGLVNTSSDGRRMIDQGGVRIGGIALEPRTYTYAREQVENQVLQVGKRRYVRPVATQE